MTWSEDFTGYGGANDGNWFEIDPGYATNTYWNDLAPANSTGNTYCLRSITYETSTSYDNYWYYNLRKKRFRKNITVEYLIHYKYGSIYNFYGAGIMGGNTNSSNNMYPSYGRLNVYVDWDATNSYWFLRFYYATGVADYPLTSLNTSGSLSGTLHWFKIVQETNNTWSFYHKFDGEASYVHCGTTTDTLGDLYKKFEDETGDWGYKDEGAWFWAGVYYDVVSIQTWFEVIQLNITADESEDEGTWPTKMTCEMWQPSIFMSSGYGTFVDDTPLRYVETFDRDMENDATGWACYDGSFLNEQHVAQWGTQDTDRDLLFSCMDAGTGDRYARAQQTITVFGFYKNIDYRVKFYLAPQEYQNRWYMYFYNGSSFNWGIWIDNPVNVFPAIRQEQSWDVYCSDGTTRYFWSNALVYMPNGMYWWIRFKQVTPTTVTFYYRVDVPGSNWITIGTVQFDETVWATGNQPFWYMYHDRNTTVYDRTDCLFRIDEIQIEADRMQHLGDRWGNVDCEVSASMLAACFHASSGYAVYERYQRVPLSGATTSLFYLLSPEFAHPGETTDWSASSTWNNPLPETTTYSTNDYYLKLKDPYDPAASQGPLSFFYTITDNFYINVQVDDWEFNNNETNKHRGGLVFTIDGVGECFLGYAHSNTLGYDIFMAKVNGVEYPAGDLSPSYTSTSYMILRQQGTTLELIIKEAGYGSYMEQILWTGYAGPYSIRSMKLTRQTDYDLIILNDLFYFVETVTGGDTTGALEPTFPVMEFSCVSLSTTPPDWGAFAYFFHKTSLTGGGVNDLDGLDPTNLEGTGQVLTTNSVCLVVDATTDEAHFMVAEEDASAIESIPNVIIPDNNAGNWAWKRANAFNSAYAERYTGVTDSLGDPGYTDYASVHPSDCGYMIEMFDVSDGTLQDTWLEMVPSMGTQGRFWLEINGTVDKDVTMWIMPEVLERHGDWE